MKNIINFILSNKKLTALIVLILMLIMAVYTILINNSQKNTTNNAIVEQVQKEQQKQIGTLNKRVDSLTNIIVIKKKADAKLESESRQQIFDLRQQIINFKKTADVQKHTIDTATIDQNFDILTAKIKARQR